MRICCVCAFVSLKETVLKEENKLLKHKVRNKVIRTLILMSFHHEFNEAANLNIYLAPHLKSIHRVNKHTFNQVEVRQMISMMSKTRCPSLIDSKIGIQEERVSLDSISCASDPLFEDDYSDTSLKLG